MMKRIVLILMLSLPFFFCSAAKNKDLLTIYKEPVPNKLYAVENESASEPSFDFTFDELVNLSQTAEPQGELKVKLNSHLLMTYVVNRNNNYKLDKPYLRVSHWNIRRGYNIAAIKEILLDSNAYSSKYIENVKSRHRKNFKTELDTFASTDIICLNEVDIGMPRTKYKNIVSGLSDSLNWDYAYSTEFIELGPIFQKQQCDKSLYKGLHGNAIVSKFPIISTHVIRLPEKYDWYKNETKEHESPLECIRKFGAKAIFSQKIDSREVRHGNREALVADIKLPNNKIVTVVTAHLEDRAFPDERLKQFKYLLENLKHIKTPIILSGDFNTSTTDTKPTSVVHEVKKRIRDPHFILRTTGSFFIPGTPPVLPGAAAITFSKLLQYKDPFFLSIPVVFPNHERKFYTCLRKFKFDDGNIFDLSGDRKKSSNRRRGLLANSNQRHWKGFKSTYKLEKPRVIAYFKLDWFFVKPIGEHFTPSNGRTLKTLNYSFPGHISDHNPITVDINL